MQNEEIQKKIDIAEHDIQTLFVYLHTNILPVRDLKVSAVDGTIILDNQKEYWEITPCLVGTNATLCLELNGTEIFSMLFDGKNQFLILYFISVIIHSHEQ